MMMMTEQQIEKMKMIENRQQIEKYKTLLSDVDQEILDWSKSGDGEYLNDLRLFRNDILKTLNLIGLQRQLKLDLGIWS